MKTPTWALVVGICMLLFGGCGAISNVNKILVPSIMDFQQDMLDNFPDNSSILDIDSISVMDSNEVVTSQEVDVVNIKNEFENMFAMSDFTVIWTVRFGYIGLLVAIVYLLAGILLLLNNKNSIRLVYIALIVSIVFSIVESSVLAMDASSGYITRFSSSGNILGVVLDIVLLVVVVVSTRSNTTPKVNQAPS